MLIIRIVTDKIWICKYWEKFRSMECERWQDTNKKSCLWNCFVMTGDGKSILPIMDGFTEHKENDSIDRCDICSAIFMLIADICCSFQNQ